VRSKTMMTRVAIVGGAVAAGLAVYARWVEPRWLQLRHPRIHVRGLPPPMEGLRIGLLTDLHAGRPADFRLIRRAVEMLMSQRPDLVALTGDFAADDARDFTEVLDALRDLRAPLGVYAVPGNHDYIVGIDLWRRDVARHPTIVDLTNGFRNLDVNGARLCVAGVDDFYEGRPRLRLPRREERDFTLLLAHSPDEAERCRRDHDAVGLIVSGHTHGGQVRFPIVGAPVSSAENDELYEEGLRRRPWTQVYTSRGIGTVRLPVRFLTRPEVTVLELTGAPRPGRDEAAGVPPLRPPRRGALRAPLNPAAPQRAADS
jgi:uncharacterized protein